MPAKRISGQSRWTAPTAVSLRRGVILEDSLKYDEAPDWLQPIRHTLGGVLMVAGHFDQAEDV